MNTRNHRALFITIIGILMMSCLLPGMIPLESQPDGPMPYMEEDPNKVIETLQSGEVQSLESLAPEQYTADDLAKPDTWTFTVTITDELPTILLYGWCAADEETLRQNFEHIVVRIYFNNTQLGNDVVHPLTYISPDSKMPCQAFSVLMSEWPDGEYTLEAVATFDEEINDGVAKYAAGDYAFVYDVTVKK